MAAPRQVDPVELEMASLLAEATGRPAGELVPHLAALVAADVVDSVEGGAGAGYRLADPELGRACAALRSAVVCRLATTERLDEWMVSSPRRPSRGSRTDAHGGG